MLIKIQIKTLLLLVAFMLIAVNLSGQQNAIRVIDDYYYFPNGRLYTGQYQIFSNDGKVLSGTVEVENGLLNGKAEYFYPDGKIKEIGFFKEGKKDGAWKKFRYNGQLEMEASYDYGKKDGLWYVYDTDGSTIYEFAYCDNRPAGHWKRWDGNGNLIAERKH